MAISNPLPNFPFTAYHVGPSGKPSLKSLVKRNAWSRVHFESTTGQLFAANELYLKESDAWDAGAQRLGDRQAKITKMQQNLDKHAKAFAKARPA